MKLFSLKLICNSSKGGKKAVALDKILEIDKE